MIIKKAVFVKKRRTISVRVSDDIYGCDCCRKKMGEDYKELRLTVFHNDGREADNLHFCSWKCVLKYLPKIKSDYFVSLPYMHFDESSPKGANASDLLALLNPKTKQ